MNFNPEWVGLLGTFIVLIAFLQTTETRIRMINCFGAVAFIVYGILIGAFSLWILNTLLLLIHIKRLTKLIGGTK